MIETSSPQTWALSFGFKHCNVLESNSEVVYRFDVPYLIYRTNIESHQCFINLSPCHWHGTSRCKFNCLISSWNCNRTPHEKKHNIDNRTQTLTIFAKTTWTHLQNQIYSVLFNIPESNRNNLSKMTNHRRPKYPLRLPSPMLGQNFVDSDDLAQKDLGTAESPEDANVLVTRDSMWLISIIQGDLIWRSLGSHNSGLASNLSKLLPSRELTYPTLGKEKSSSNMIFDGIC